MVHLPEELDVVTLILSATCPLHLLHLLLPPLPVLSLTERRNYTICKRKERRRRRRCARPQPIRWRVSLISNWSEEPWTVTSPIRSGFLPINSKILETLPVRTSGRLEWLQLQSCILAQRLPITYIPCLPAAQRAGFREMCAQTTFGYKFTGWLSTYLPLVPVESLGAIGHGTPSIKLTSTAFSSRIFQDIDPPSLTSHPPLEFPSSSRTTARSHPQSLPCRSSASSRISCP